MDKFEEVVSVCSELINKVESLGEKIRYEGDVYKAELEDRLLLGLNGQDAIEHYNSWMIKYGLFHLVVS